MPQRLPCKNRGLEYNPNRFGACESSWYQQDHDLEFLKINKPKNPFPKIEVVGVFSGIARPR